MPKDTKSSGYNKAPTCESRGFGYKKEGANFDTPSSVFYSLSVHYPINRNTGEINQRLYIRVAS